jgi:uncharacterized membrane protein
MTVVNKEHHPQAYEIRVLSDNGYVSTIFVEEMAQGAKWTKQIQIPEPFRKRLNHLSFQLFISQQAQPYRELHLWLNQPPVLP